MRKSSVLSVAGVPLSVTVPTNAPAPAALDPRRANPRCEKSPLHCPPDPPSHGAQLPAWTLSAQDVMVTPGSELEAMRTRSPARIALAQASVYCVVPLVPAMPWPRVQMAPVTVVLAFVESVADCVVPGLPLIRLLKSAPATPAPWSMTLLPLLLV